MKTLIDTNILSESHKPKANPAVVRRLNEAAAADLFLSVISIGEIAHGIALLPPGKRRRELDAWIQMTEHNFADRVLPIGRDTAHLWGELTARVSRKGRTIHPADGLIAATALEHGLHLMTRNASDFEYTGVLVINPWQD